LPWGERAQNNISIPAGDTLIDPKHISFFQALKIASKVYQGQISTIHDTLLVPKGEVVSKSVSDLLRILKIKASIRKPNVEAIFIQGYRVNLQSVSIEAIRSSFIQGIQQAAAMSVQLGMANALSIPFYIRSGYTNILSTCLQLGIPAPILRKKASILPNLHMIIPYLTIKDVFSCIQVCKSWSNVILSRDDIWFCMFHLMQQKPISQLESKFKQKYTSNWRYVLKRYLSRKKLQHLIDSLQKLGKPDEPLYTEIINLITNLEEPSTFMNRVLEAAVFHFSPSWTDEQQIMWYNFVESLLSMHSEMSLAEALMNSLKHNDFRLTNYLFSHYSKKKSVTKQSWKFFYEAVRRGCSVNIVKLFVDSDIKYNITDFTRDGQTIMHIAVLYNSLNVMKFLVSLGSMKDAYDNQFYTPLMLILQHNPSQFQVCL
jgi:hypothetical protein